MKNKLLVIIAIVVIGFIAPQCQSSVSGELKKKIEQMNEKCPMDMGGGISLDAIALGVGKRLDLAFTVRFIAIDDAEAQMFSAKVGPMLLESFKMDDSEEFRKFKDANLDLVCCFYDKNGDSLTTVTLLSKEYK